VNGVRSTCLPGNHRRLHPPIHPQLATCTRMPGLAAGLRWSPPSALPPLATDLVGHEATGPAASEMALTCPFAFVMVTSENTK
jgi:hypothetical protein